MNSLTDRSNNRGVAAAAILLLCLHLPAHATHPKEDSFSRTTGNGTSKQLRTPAEPAYVKMTEVHLSPASAAKDFFLVMDRAVAKLKPTNDDRFVLKRPFNQEVERVNEWTKTAAKISRNYRQLAMVLRSMPESQVTAEVNTYRTRMADWYADSADVFDDMIRPRPPARTKEELDDSLQEVHKRSKSLKDSLSSLQQMDSEIRKKYNIPLADNALLDYTGKH